MFWSTFRTNHSLLLHFAVISFHGTFCGKVVTFRGILFHYVLCYISRRHYNIYRRNKHSDTSSVPVHVEQSNGPVKWQYSDLIDKYIGMYNRSNSDNDHVVLWSR